MSRLIDSLLEENNLIRYNNEPTHMSGNTIDLIIAEPELINSVKVDKRLVSDHFCITCNIAIEKPVKTPTIFRSDYNWNKVPATLFFDNVSDDFIPKAELLSSSNDSSEIVNNLFNGFLKSVEQIKTSMVPVTHRKVCYGKPKYFDEECALAKRKKRKLERILKKNSKTVKTRFDTNRI